MTPEQLAELHEAWPGGWHRVIGGDDYELPPNAAGWAARAGIFPWNGTAALNLYRRPSNETFAASGTTFTAAAVTLRTKLRNHALELLALAEGQP